MTRMPSQVSSSLGLLTSWRVVPTLSQRDLKHNGMLTCSEVMRYKLMRDALASHVGFAPPTLSSCANPNELSRSEHLDGTVESCTKVPATANHVRNPGLSRTAVRFLLQHESAPLFNLLHRQASSKTCPRS